MSDKPFGADASAIAFDAKGDPEGKDYSSFASHK